MILLPDSLSDAEPCGRGARAHSTSPDGFSPSIEELVEQENAQAAWCRVRRNGGCAGVDGVTVAELEPVFAQAWDNARSSLLNGRYSRVPLRRVRIPKPSGGMRLLGIPSVFDRIVDQAAAQIFLPHWEPRFSPRSFAYRSGRGARDALARFESVISRGAEWVLHLDIENFFDSVPHATVFAALRHELADPRLAGLLDRILRCGVFEHGLVRPVRAGLAQGSPLSPLLANIVLHSLDVRLEQQGVEFVRYADDCCVLLPREDLGLRWRAVLEEWLAELGLRVNDKKTAFGLFTATRFLGFAFRKNAKGYIERYASPESLGEAETVLRHHAANAAGDAQSMASELSQMLRGWLAYFLTPQDELRLKALVETIVSDWRKRFERVPVPECLSWERLVGSASASRSVDYSGHLRDTFSFLDSLDWTQTLRCIGMRLLRSRWWGFEYDIGWGNKPPMLRVRLGSHRINLRF